MNAGDFTKMRNRAAAERVIKGLERRHMEGYYAETGEEALSIALSLIPEGSSVGWGGSFSVEEIGLKQALREGNYRCIDRDTAKSPEERNKMMREIFSADAFIMGTNAITEDGVLVNMDGMGNRVSALIFGPGEVVVIAGMNKLVKTVEDAVSRTRNIAAPVNQMRFQGDTVCTKTGTCGNCTMDGCICSQLVVTRNSSIHGRIKVILVNENLGM